MSSAVNMMVCNLPLKSSKVNVYAVMELIFTHLLEDGFNALSYERPVMSNLNINVDA